MVDINTSLVAFYLTPVYIIESGDLFIPVTVLCLSQARPRIPSAFVVVISAFSKCFGILLKPVTTTQTVPLETYKNNTNHSSDRPPEHRSDNNRI
jgi:hypothetical protein